VEAIMTPDIINALAQFGPAGLIGILWIAERRQAARRDRQLTEAHHKLAGKELSLEALLDVVKDNTRAIVTLEQTQRQLIDVAQRIGHPAVRSSAP
jgi:hypothetical protein